MRRRQALSRAHLSRGRSTARRRIEGGTGLYIGAITLSVNLVQHLCTGVRTPKMVFIEARAPTPVNHHVVTKRARRGGAGMAAQVATGVPFATRFRPLTTSPAWVGVAISS